MVIAAAAAAFIDRVEPNCAIETADLDRDLAEPVLEAVADHVVHRLRESDGVNRQVRIAGRPLEADPTVIERRTGLPSPYRGRDDLAKWDGVGGPSPLPAVDLGIELIDGCRRHLQR